jgi:hypothetical protein
MANGLWLATIDRMRPCVAPGCRAQSIGLVSKVGEGKYKRMFDPEKETLVTLYYCADHEQLAKDYLNTV